MAAPGHLAATVPPATMVVSGENSGRRSIPTPSKAGQHTVAPPGLPLGYVHPGSHGSFQCLPLRLVGVVRDGSGGECHVLLCGQEPGAVSTEALTELPPSEQGLLVFDFFMAI